MVQFRIVGEEPSTIGKREFHLVPVPIDRICRECRIHRNVRQVPDSLEDFYDLSCLRFHLDCIIEVLELTTTAYTKMGTVGLYLVGGFFQNRFYKSLAVTSLDFGHLCLDTLTGDASFDKPYEIVISGHSPGSECQVIDDEFEGLSFLIRWFHAFSSYD